MGGSGMGICVAIPLTMIVKKPCRVRFIRFWDGPSPITCCDMTPSTIQVTRTCPAP
jgi:hypothetical protein